MEFSNKIEELFFLDESEEIRKEFVNMLSLNLAGGETLAKVALEGLAGTSTTQDATAEAIAKVGSSIIPILILLLKDKSEHIRNGAVKTLKEIGHPAVEFLIQALSSKSQLVRYGVAKTLGEIKDQRAVGPFIQTLKDENGDCRRIAAKALGQLKNKAGVKPLIKAMEEDNDDFVRVAAAKALGVIGDARSSAKALSQVLNDKSKDIQKAAREALEQLKEIKKFYSTL